MSELKAQALKSLTEAQALILLHNMAFSKSAFFISEIRTLIPPLTGFLLVLVNGLTQVVRYLTQ